MNHTLKTFKNTKDIKITPMVKILLDWWIFAVGGRFCDQQGYPIRGTIAIETTTRKGRRICCSDVDSNLSEELAPTKGRPCGAGMGPEVGAFSGISTPRQSGRLQSNHDQRGTIRSWFYCRTQCSAACRCRIGSDMLGFSV